jgi:hypothetical protein
MKRPPIWGAPAPSLNDRSASPPARPLLVTALLVDEAIVVGVVGLRACSLKVVVQCSANRTDDVGDLVLNTVLRVSASASEATRHGAASVGATVALSPRTTTSRYE